MNNDNNNKTDIFSALLYNELENIDDKQNFQSNYSDYNIGIAIISILVIIFFIAFISGFSGGSGNRYKNLTKEQKSYLQQTYGNGKSQAIDKAIKDYKSSH